MRIQCYTEAIKSQNLLVMRINLHDLADAPVDWEKLEQGVHGEKNSELVSEYESIGQSAIC